MTDLERGDAALLACNSYFRDGDETRSTVKFLESQMWYARVGQRLLGAAARQRETFRGECRAVLATESWREI